MKTLIKTFCALSILFLVSCSSEDGRDGMDGNANVISSDWIPTEFSSTAVNFTNFVVQDDNINTENATNAAVIAHGINISGEIVTIPFARNSRFYYFSLSPDTNEIIFRAENLIGNQSIFNDLTAVRYTIIPSN